jgi:hypothetical protein
MSAAARSAWTNLTERQLLAQCDVDTYRASGPGGQKRNKTSSAVRLRHGPSGLIVIAEESRSQHENKARALRRLRKQLFLKLREPFPPADAELLLAELRERHWKLGLKDERYWPAVGLALDALEANAGRVSEAAGSLGVLTSHLVDFLAGEPKVWEQANLLRRQFGHKPLKIGA